MGFPVPGDAIEPSLDLNRYLIHTPAATFLMEVEGDMVANTEVRVGDLLIVDRALTAVDGSLVIGSISGQLQVLRVQNTGSQLEPFCASPAKFTDTFEIWGVVTTIIRKV